MVSFEDLSKRVPAPRKVSDWVLRCHGVRSGSGQEELAGVDGRKILADLERARESYLAWASGYIEDTDIIPEHLPQPETGWLGKRPPCRSVRAIPSGLMGL